MAEEVTGIGAFEAALSAAVEAVDCVAFRQCADDRFRLTEVPFDLLDDQNNPGHLLFDLYVADGVTVEHQGTTEFQTWRVICEFTYNLQECAEQVDKRLAGDAGSEVLRALLGGVDSRESSGPPTRATVTAGSLGAPGVAPGVSNRWLRVNCEITANVCFRRDAPCP